MTLYINNQMLRRGENDKGKEEVMEGEGRAGGRRTILGKAINLDFTSPISGNILTIASAKLPP